MKLNSIASIAISVLAVCPVHMLDHRLRGRGGENEIDSSSSSAVVAHHHHHRHGREMNRKLQNGMMCWGETLYGGQTLFRTQYLCDPSKLHDTKFGMDELGRLRVWDGDKIRWSSGVTGDFLIMQTDGSIAMYKIRSDGKNEAVWATDCFSPGAKLHKPHRGLPRVLDADGKTVWKIYNNGMDSLCYPTSTPPPINCRGNVLGPRVQLFRNEYLCDYTGRIRRFGLNARGQLALWHDNSIVWTPGFDEKADYLIMRGDGRLYLFEKTLNETKAVWNSRCKEDEAIARLHNGGVEVVGRNDEIKWMVNSYGDQSSDCDNPIVTTVSDCSKVSPIGTNTCKIRMIDHQNMNYVALSVEDLGDGKYTVTDRVNQENEIVRTETIEVYTNGTINIDEDFPDITCGELLVDYEMKDSMQLTFLDEPYYPCTSFGKDLLYFMVNERFYSD